MENLDWMVITEQSQARLVEHGVHNVQQATWLLDEELIRIGLSLGEVAFIRQIRSRVRQPTNEEPETAPSSVRKVRIPKDLPSYHPDKAGERASDWLERLKCALTVEEVPQQRWTAALVKCVKGPAQLWVKREILDKSLSWQEACVAFLQHFTHADERLDRLADWIGIEMKPTETVRQFGERYLQIVQNAGKKPTSKTTLYLFLRALVPDLQTKYAGAIAQRPVSTLYEAISLAISLETSTKKRLGPAREDRTGKHARSEAVGGSSKSSDTRKVCKHHPQATNHTTEECLKERMAPSSSYSPKKLVPSLGRSDKPINEAANEAMKKPAAVGDQSTIICYRCKAPGHKAPDCPTNDKKQFKVIDDNRSSPYVVPLLINGVSVNGLIDTGASHGFIDESFCQKLPCRVDRQDGQTVDLGTQGATAEQLGVTELLTVQAGDRLLEYSFTVLHLRSEYEQVIVGRELLEMLGFYFSKVPYNRPTTFNETDEPPVIDVEDEHVNHPDTQKILEAISPELDDNVQKIGPGMFCPLPEALVRLDVPEGKRVFIRQYTIAERLKAPVEEQIHKWLQERVIEEINYADSNNPLVCAFKKDATTGRVDNQKVRVCIDFRALNKLIPTVNCHVPLIQEIFEALNGATIFSVLDIKGAFNRFLIEESSRKHTAFQINHRTYQCVGAPFGLKFMTQQFQRVMGMLIKPYTEHCLVFVDDIIIFSKTTEEHIVHLKEIINVLTDNNLPLALEKCQLACASVHLLGHQINSEGCRIDKRKIIDLHQRAKPTAKNIESHIGFVNYFRLFIPNYSNLMAPIEKVRKKFSWGPEQEVAWRRVIDVLEQAPLLYHPVWTQHFYLATDGCGTGIAATLFQIESGKLNTKELDSCNEKFKYISFAARALSPTERRYPATKLEMLAIVFGLIKYRKYLLGRRFTLITDHRSLVWLHNERELGRSTVCWLEILLEYDFEIIHCPGIYNVLPDRLSRMYDVSGGSESQMNDSTLMLIEQSDPESRVEVTDEVQKLALMTTVHEEGHFGSAIMITKLHHRGHRWTNMTRDCVAFVAKCVQCQRHNIVKRGFHPLQPIHASLPFDHLALDLIGPMPLSDGGFNYILTIVDVATRFTILRPLQTKLASEMVETLFKIMCDFGLAKIIQSDNGKEFSNQLMREFMNLCKSAQRFLTPYHPSANGLVEKMNHSVIQTLKKMLDGVEHEWVQRLPAVQLMLNTKVNQTTGSEPFSLMFGRMANLRKDYTHVRSQLLTETELKERVQEMNRLVYPSIAERMVKRQSKLKQKVDESRKIISIQVGDSVMTTDLLRSSKLSPKYEGPFQVVEKTKGGSYRLLGKDGQLLKRAFPPEQLKLVAQDEDASSSYVVEKITNHRKRLGAYQYFVKWQGYSEEDSTWEAASQFDDVEVIRRYWQAQRKKKK